MKKEECSVIERYGNPSDFDYAPYLSICINTTTGNAWVQLARDDQNPLWERFSSLEDALEFISKKNQ